jgi:cytidylate kinase
VTPSIVLSGTMFSGKTTIAELLRDQWGYVVVSARAVLRQLSPDSLLTREALQQFGTALEKETDGSWLGAATAAVALEDPATQVVVDSARTRAQIHSVRQALPGVRHVHLTAPLDVLESRFASTTKGLVEPPSFKGAIAHPVEREAASLGEIADVVLNSADGEPDAVVAQLIRALSGSTRP